MKIEKNKVVVMTYRLYVDGKLTDEATAEDPLDYIQGSHMLIPKIEETLSGLEEGSEFECTIDPEDAYGEYDMKKVFDVAKETFVVDGQLREDLLEVGRYIPLLNSAGEVCQGMIVAVGEDKVTMDFNAPMAGKTLHFTGNVLSVRDATAKELLEGLHGEFLPPEEGCHCHGGCPHHHHDGEGCCHHGDGDGGCHHHHQDDEGCCHHGEGEGCCHHSDEEGCCCHED